MLFYHEHCLIVLSINIKLINNSYLVFSIICCLINCIKMKNIKRKINKKNEFIELETCTNSIDYLHPKLSRINSRRNGNISKLNERGERNKNNIFPDEKKKQGNKFSQGDYFSQDFYFLEKSLSLLKTSTTINNMTIYDPNTKDFYENQISLSSRDSEHDLEKLKKIYKSFSTNEKINLNSYLKFLAEVKILNNNFNSKYATAIYYNIANKDDNINFINFCQILVKISEIKYPNDYIENPNFAYEKLLSGVFANKTILATFSNNNIDAEKNRKNIIIIDQEAILKKFSNTDKKLKHFYISKHIYLLSKIYDVYFPFENIQKIKNNYLNEKYSPQIQNSNFLQSEKSFLNFCKDFELYNNNTCGLKQLTEIFNTVIGFSEIVLKAFKDISSITEDIPEVDEFEIPNFSFNTKSNLIDNKGSNFTLYHFISAIYVISYTKLRIDYKHVLFEDSSVKELAIKSFSQVIQNFYKTNSIQKISSLKYADNTRVKQTKDINTLTNAQNSYRVTDSKNLDEPYENYSHIFTRYKAVILVVYKHFSEISQTEKNISVMMNISGLRKFLQSISALRNKDDINSFCNSISYDMFNFIFSKFSFISSDESDFCDWDCEAESNFDLENGKKSERKMYEDFLFFIIEKTNLNREENRNRI